MKTTSGGQYFKKAEKNLKTVKAFTTEGGT